jgi:hypothetical protein
MDLEIAEDVGGADTVGAILASATISDLPTVLTFVDFTVSPEALLTPGASYWLVGVTAPEMRSAPGRTAEQ